MRAKSLVAAAPAPRKFHRKPMPPVELEEYLAVQWFKPGDHPAILVAPPELVSAPFIVVSSGGRSSPVPGCHCPRNGPRPPHGLLLHVAAWDLVCPGDWIYWVKSAPDCLYVCRDVAFHSSFDPA